MVLKFEQIDKNFKKVNDRLNKIEYLISNDYKKGLKKQRRT